MLLIHVCFLPSVMNLVHVLTRMFLHCYCLRQGGYVIVVVGLFICLLATLRKKLANGFA